MAELRVLHVIIILMQQNFQQNNLADSIFCNYATRELEGSVGKPYDVSFIICGIWSETQKNLR